MNMSENLEVKVDAAKQRYPTQSYYYYINEKFIKISIAYEALYSNTVLYNSLSFARVCNGKGNPCTATLPLH